MKKINLRLAEIGDAEQILDIYAPYVLHTAITFEVDVPEIEDFRQRINDAAESYPYLVCEIEGRIVAYAYAHRYLARAAYDWNAELSVYVKEEYCRHCHIGTALYTALRDILRLQNMQNLYGLVADTNVRSFALHKKIGFKKIATYNKIGYKFGQWHNVSVFEMSLGEHKTPAQRTLAVKEIGGDKIKEILQYCQKLIIL